jgi:hypothetical protein
MMKFEMHNKILDYQPIKSLNLVAKLISINPN